MAPDAISSAIGMSEKRVRSRFIRAILMMASRPRNSASQNISTPDPKQS